MIVPIITENLKVLPYIVKGLAMDWAQRDMVRPLGLEHFLLMQCVSGEGVIDINGESLKVNPNDVFIWEPNKAQSYLNIGDEGWCVNWLGFSCEELPFCLNNGFIKVDYFPKSVGRVRLNTIKQLLEEETLSSYIRASGEVYLLLCELAIYINGSISKDDSFDLGFIIEFMKQNLHKQISLKELSQMFNISQSYICKLFNKQYQITPIQYLIELKLNRAKILLVTNPDLKVYKVAEMCGYEDQVYFSRVFKKYIGQTPSEYRKQNM